jgi:hypothetical protein
VNPQPYFRLLDRPVAQIVERVRPGYYAERHLPNPLVTRTSWSGDEPLVTHRR